MKTIMCFGDSNTYGYDPRNGRRYPKEDRWTTKLQNLLGEEYEIIPEGLNGRTTSYDRPEKPWKNGARALLSCFCTHKPVDEIVFMLGTNDCNSNMHLSAQDICDGMENLIVMVHENINDVQDFIPEMTIVVPGAILDKYEVSPFSDQLDESSVQKSKEIAPLYKKIAEKYHCKFLDASDKLEVSELDSEHLTLLGHQKLAELLADILK